MTDTQQLVAAGIEYFIIFASIWTFLFTVLVISQFRSKA